VKPRLRLTIDAEKAIIVLSTFSGVNFWKRTRHGSYVIANWNVPITPLPKERRNISEMPYLRFTL